MENPEDKNDSIQQIELHVPHHAWRARFAIGLIMLAIAFIGVAVTDVQTGGAWYYWRIMAPIYALLSVGLSLYLRHMRLRSIVWTIWHEVLHWLGLIVSVYVLSLLVSIGLVSRFQEGLQVLLLLALATFLAGVYIEPTFIVVGIILEILALVIAFISQYMYGIMLPIIAVAIALIFWISRRHKHREVIVPHDR